MPANRQSSPGFFNFMNTPSQRTSAALKDQQSNTASRLAGEAAAKPTAAATTPASAVTPAGVVNTNQTNAAVEIQQANPPVVITPELSDLPTKGQTIAIPNNAVSRVVASTATNVLSHYRSYTYNFTLATIDATSANDPTSYRSINALNNVVLKSGGKGTRVINATGKSFGDDAKTLVDGFNAYSPGQFDMFVENVEIESLTSFSERTGASLATNIKFEIIEPYSINGVIEALHVAAVAAGYPTYTDAVFVLATEFLGYPDTTELSNVKNIDGATRFFPFKLTGIEVEVTERGTVYRVAGVPINEKAFGISNTLKEPVSMSGVTVKEILESLMTGLNAQVEDSDKKSTKNPSANSKYDSYEIVFPTRDISKPGGWDYTKTNDIGNNPLLEVLVDKAIYNFPDPGKVTLKNNYNLEGNPLDQTAVYNPKDVQIQFAEKANVHEIISSVIRDSVYVRNLLKNLPDYIDEYGYVKYFIVKLEVINTGYDVVNRKPYQLFRYVVTPYDIHYTRVPNYYNTKIDPRKIQLQAHRVYNYIYTGQNTEVLNFKLNFNTLFFEAIPKAMGNSDAVPSKDGVKPGNTTEPKADEVDTPTDANGKTKRTTVPNTTDIQSVGGNAGANQIDPYTVLAKNMHNALINSHASMISGEIDIVGDPFYLVTGGMGNYNPPIDKNGNPITGEADHQLGEILINIIFNNPIDIDKDTGFMYFNKKQASFSGIYRVIKVTSIFKDGEFKQRLDVIRMAGQIDANVAASDPRTFLTSSANPQDTTTQDAADVAVSAATQSNNPLSNNTTMASAQDAASAVDKIASQFNSVASSVESKIAAVNILSGSAAGNGTNVVSAVTSQFGSKGLSSPLTTLMNA